MPAQQDDTQLLLDIRLFCLVFFAGPRPALRLMASDLIGDDVIRLTYVPT
jgi:hypothetical protein